MLFARALLLLVPVAAGAATGEEIYKSKCALCHDGGSAQAPRISRADEWAPRLARGRQALVESAIRGVPNSPMTPKAGYVELSDAEIAATVNYMLDRSGAVAGPAVPVTVAVRKASPARDDATLIREVGEALQKARIPGVKVESMKGEVTLRGIVENAKEARQAEEAAYAVPGVARVLNELSSAAVFEWD